MGEESCYEAPECGHAHADYAYVELEWGEDAAEHVVVDGVGGPAVLGECPEAGYGYYYRSKK